MKDETLEHLATRLAPLQPTLRDYFAASALTGLLMRFGNMSNTSLDKPVVALAYAYADAMLEERAK